MSHLIQCNLLLFINSAVAMESKLDAVKAMVEQLTQGEMIELKVMVDAKIKD